MDEMLALANNRHVPLADRMRPRSLDEVIGQPQLTAEDAPLRRAVADQALGSIVLWGPPGTGKTTIALCLARDMEAHFEQLNAVTDGIKELREIIKRADSHRSAGEKTLLFIDEIARWNKAQQDALLPYVENGTVILVGATTEHPSYELNRALLSRLQVHKLVPLSEQALRLIADRALRDVKRGVGIAIDSGLEEYSLTDEAATQLLLVADGDARRLLGIIERAAQLLPDGGPISLDVIENASGSRAHAYDKGKDEHYATVSAFIKSIRGSDVDAAIYWLARMRAGGEDPVFVARRLVIAASEEVGVAASGALAVAVAGMQAVQMVGPPECWINLAHVTAYLARAPKSWASYQALGYAGQVIDKYPNYPVPMVLRNPSNTLDREAGMGKDYIHASKPGSETVEFLPPELKGLKIYKPSGNGQDK
jgi:putative ATPase